MNTSSLSAMKFMNHQLYPRARRYGSFPKLKGRTVTVNGFAKGFAMTGWRLGYMGAPRFIADACSKIQGQVTSGAASFGQKAGAVALAASLEPTYAMREAFRERRDIVISMIQEIPGH
jgi:aspartate aminotransferase